MDFAGSVHCRVAGKAHGSGGAAGWAVAWATDRREPALKPVRGAMFSEVEILLDGEGTSTLSRTEALFIETFSVRECFAPRRFKSPFRVSLLSLLASSDLRILTNRSSLCSQL